MRGKSVPKDDLERWKNACGFRTWDEAIAALQIAGRPTARTIYRWKEDGLPTTITGALVAKRMASIERRRTKEKS